MKKIVIIIVLILVIPLSVKAFSVSGLWDKMFKDFDPSEKGIEYESLNETLADEKYTAWLTAYETKSLYGLMSNRHYLYFYNADANYIINKRLSDLEKPPCDYFRAWFKENYVYLEAHLIKYLPGNVSGEVEFVKKGTGVLPKVRKMKWGKIGLPVFIANVILNRELDDLVAFMNSDPDFPYVKIEILEDYFEISFEQN